VRTTMPWRRVVLASYSSASSSSEEQSDESSLYPHRAPPQSSLTRSPERVIPYRSHVQQLLPELTLDGEELLVERDVSDGTDSLSESIYESSSDNDEADDAGDIVCRANLLVNASSVALSYCVAMTWRVWCGRSGLGAIILEGESERPLGIEAVLIRRECRFELECEERSFDDEDEELLVLPGISRMLSLRPVVGSVV
jgi:hypothetical protein